MGRGVRRLSIFQDDFDYAVFKELLKVELMKDGCKLHAYCFMTNHFHLLLETGNIEIGKFMKNLESKYAMQYNHRHFYKGHMFEDRYKSCLVQGDDYFLQTSRYIHLNPMKAKMVAHPEDYRWSSYKSMINLMDDDISIKEKTLSYFGSKGVWGYREFVEDTAHKYFVSEDKIRKVMGEDELWLPW